VRQPKIRVERLKTTTSNFGEEKRKLQFKEQKGLGEEERK
jgi:hypothetical protein